MAGPDGRAGVGGESSKSVWPNHRAQLAVYFLLIEDQLGVKPPHGQDAHQFSALPLPGSCSRQNRHMYRSTGYIPSIIAIDLATWLTVAGRSSCWCCTYYTVRGRATYRFYLSSNPSYCLTYRAFVNREGQAVILLSIRNAIRIIVAYRILSLALWTNIGIAVAAAHQPCYGIHADIGSHGGRGAECQQRHAVGDRLKCIALAHNLSLN